MATFTDLCIEEIIAHLESTCATGTTPADTAYAGLIRMWPLQEDPEDHRISILVAECDPTDEEDSWAHEVDYDRLEIGRSRIPWRRRFSIHLEMYFTRTGESQSDAYKVARAMMGKVEEAFALWHPQSTGDNGESCVFCPGVVSSHMRPGGGIENENVFFGKLLLEYLTE